MKLVLTMIDGVWQVPVDLDIWLDQNDTLTGYDAMVVWLYGAPFMSGGGAAGPECVSYLIDTGGSHQ